MSHHCSSRRLPPRPSSRSGLALLGVLTLAACAGKTARPEPTLSAVLDEVVVGTENAPGRRASGTDFLILHERIDYSRLAELMDRQGWTKTRRRRQVPSLLAELSRRSQANLLSEARRLQAAGSLEDVHGLRIVNWVAVRGDPAAIQELSRRPEVAGLLPCGSLLPDPRSARVRLDRPSRPASPPPEPWAHEVLAVAEARRRGLTGRGVRVAIADTGVDASLAVLRPGFEAGGWFDPTSRHSEPWDSEGHGTEVLSLAVARDPDVGVAPGASWIAALANPANRIQGLELARSLDFLAEQRPDILILAFGSRRGECHPALRPFLNAFLAAETFLVMAAGNEGPNLGTDISPANLVELYPGQAAGFAVGALDREMDPHQHSGRGPRSCDPTVVYPTVAAPGVRVRTWTKGRLTGITGSSGAAGLVAGAAALLLEAKPSLGAQELGRLLTSTARDIRPQGIDMFTGYGLVDLGRALEALEQGSPSSSLTRSVGRQAMIE